MKEESYQKYWEIIKDFNSKEELNNIKKNIESINAILYHQLKEKENIKISSLDSLLSNINNYYDDEIYLNKLIIGEIAL